ncbi:MAG: hypothetical protein JNM09_22610 [Blastocatellia bacterium]|nr:hypothetical protein [Blastocatellia bacterium]
MRIQQRLKLTAVSTALLAFLLSIASAQKQAERFDLVVREDFFAGLAGNAEALKRGMAKCEEKLKAEPDNAEALVWHGAGLQFQSVSYFQKNEMQKGIELYQQGETEMDRAVQLQPKSISILVPRAAHYVVFSRYVPDKEQQRTMLTKVIHDYEEVYRQQQPHFDKLSEHARGELLLGLAEAYLRSGGEENRGKANELLKLAQQEKSYVKEATTWLQAAPEAKPSTFFHTCVGCHAK